MTSARHFRAGLAGLVLASTLGSPAIQAAPSERIELCKGAPPARQDEMIVVDSAFRRMPDKTLRLGTIDLSVSRHVDGQFFIVAPLGSRPAATLGTAQIHTAIDSLAKCGDKTVFGLSFDFDNSTLPPGAFSMPLSVFKEGAQTGDSALAAAPATVAGNLRRAWISAALSPAAAGPPGMFEVRLTNTGNIPSAPLMFAPVGDSMALLRVGTNACQARTLSPDESCRIDVALPGPGAGAGDGQFEWPIDVGPHAGVTLRVQRRDGKLSADASNR